MQREIIDLLACPRSGQGLTLDVVKADADEVEYGILRSEAGVYPIVSGIPVFTSVDGSLVDLVRTARFEEATALAAFGGLPQPRLSRLAAALTPELPGPLARAMERVARRQVDTGRRTVFAADGSLRPESVLRFGYLESAGRSVDAYNYFAYRYGSPRHLVALSCIEAAPEGDGAVLDFGCGAGHLTWALKERMSRQAVIGMDKAFFLLLFARHVTVPMGSFVCADGAALPIRSTSCALVFASDVLSFVTDKWPVMQQLARVLADDACLMVTSVKNSRQRHVYAGEPLSPAGWSGLFGDLDHRVLADTDILERYLQGRGPLGGAAEPAAVEASRMLSILATRGKARIGCLERFDGWPHARGALAVNPLFRPAAGGGPQRTYVRQFPSQTYVDDNPEMVDYLPPSFSLPDGGLATARSGNDSGLHDLIASLCVLGLPAGARHDL